MNLSNWLFIFMMSLLGIGALGYLTRLVSRRRNGVWNVMSLALASLVSAAMFATLFAYSPLVTSAVRTAAAQTVSCLGTPALVRAGDTISVTGIGEPGSEVTIAQGETALATTAIEDNGEFAATFALESPGVQTLNCQIASATGEVQTIVLSFLVIGQSAPTAPPATDTPQPPTNTPEPTATNTAEPTATDAPTADAPVIDTSSIPAELLPGATFRLLGTAAGGAKVRVTVNNRVVGAAVAGPSGNWRTTIGFASGGTYTLTAQLLEGNTILAASEPVFVTVLEPTPTPEPPTNTPEPTATNTPEPTATNTPVPATDTPQPTATNTPEPEPPVVDTASIPEQILPGDTFRLRGTADGGAKVRVTVNNRVVGAAVAGPSGDWRTTIGFASGGTYTLTTQLLEGDTVLVTSEPIFVTVLEPTPTPEPPTNTPEPTATNTPEPTDTDTPEPPTNTSEPTATNTPEPTATNTPEPPTNTPEPTATNTPEPTATNTPEPPTNTPEPTATNTPEPTATNTPEPEPPVVDTASIPEQLLPGDTFRLRGTADGGAKVRVTVNNRVVGAAVAGPSGDWRTTIGFASAGTYTLTTQLLEGDTVLAASEPIFVTVLEPTPTPEPTATNTPEPTATDTPEPPTNTPEPTATNTPEPPTNTPEPTATNTPEPTATNTPEPPTNTPEPTATNTPEPTATNTPEPVPPVVDTASIPEQLLPGDTFRLRGTADGSAKVRITVNNRVVGAAVAGPNGNWRTTIGFASAGTYTLTTQLMEGDAVLAASEPIFVTVLEPTPTPEPTIAAAVDASQGVSETVAVSDTVTAAVDASQGVSDTVAVSDTVTAAVDASQGVSETVAVSDTVTSDPVAPDALPGTGGDFSQGVPWVVMLLLIGAVLVLGLGRLSKEPTA